GGREVTLEDEVPVLGVRGALVLDRAARGDERLGEHLSTEDAAGADVPVLPAVDVVLDRLEVQQLQEDLDGGWHQRVADEGCRGVTTSPCARSKPPCRRPAPS